MEIKCGNYRVSFGTLLDRSVITVQYRVVVPLQIAEQDGAVFDFPPGDLIQPCFGKYFFTKAFINVHSHTIDETWLDQNSFWIHLLQPAVLIKHH